MKMDRSWLSDSLDLISSQDKACLLLSNNYNDPYGKFHWMLGLGSKQVFNFPEELNAFSGLALGHIKYSFKSRDFYRAFWNNSHQNIYNNSNFAFFEPQVWMAQPREGDLMFGGDWIGFSDWESACTAIPRKSKFQNLDISQLQ